MKHLLLFLVIVFMLCSCAHANKVYVKEESIKIKTTTKVTTKTTIQKKTTIRQEDIKKDLELRSPVINYVITSSFGWRKSPFTKKKQFHRGLDLAAPIGTRVLAAADGTVTAVGKYDFLEGCGKTILISHGNHIYTQYVHLGNFYVKRGQNVTVGQAIGTIGVTGRTTGPHLHFELVFKSRTLNPALYMKATPIGTRIKEAIDSTEIGSGVKKLINLFTRQ